LEQCIREQKMAKFLSKLSRRGFRAFILAVVLTLLWPSQAFSWVGNQPASRVLGQPNFTSSGYATVSGFTPAAIVSDPASGKLFVADREGNRVLRFASAATLSNLAEAEAVLGQPDFNNVTGSAAQNRMYGPFGLAMDANGRLWVADAYNNRVLRFDNAASKATGANADGVLGQANFTDNASSATQNGMAVPYGLAVEGERLWVVDTYNNRVLRFENAASKPNGANADGVLGQLDFTSSASAVSQAGFETPLALALDGGRLWVADSGNNRVLRFNNAASKNNGDNADGVLGQTDFTSNVNGLGPARFSDPRGLYVEGGRLWVADTNNNRVLRFENAAGKINGGQAEGVLGQTGFTSDAAAHTQSGLSGPRGVSGDGSGRLWAADTNNNRVLRFDAAVLKANGGAADGLLGQPDYTAFTPLAAPNGLKDPASVAVDPVSGKIFVADSSHNRVLRFSNARSLSNGEPAEGVLGQPDFARTAPAVTQAGMDHPCGLSFDAAGRLWVADTGNSRVLRFDNAAAKTNGANADGVLGQSNFTTNIASIGQKTMDHPEGVAAGGDGRLWVMDSNNHRVLRFDGAASKTKGASADGVLGQTDFISRSSALTQNGMNGPAAGAWDAAGHLWVVDANNQRVLRFDDAANKANGANADGVLGQADFTSKITGTAANRFYYPAGAACDSTGRLWVADYYNHRVLRFDNAAAKSNGDNADSVLGQPDFTSSSQRPAAADSFYFPRGVSLDGDHRLWVSDTGNDRVLIFRGPQAILGLTAPAPTLAQTVSFTVTFETPVNNLSAANFSLVSTGSLNGAVITGVSSNGGGGAQTDWTVTANMGSGEGSLALSLDNTNGVQDINANPIDGLPAVSPAYILDKSGPTAVLVSAPNVSQTGGGEYLLTVRYEDLIPISAASLKASNLVVSGPNALNLTVNSVELSSSTDGAPITATYHLNPPGGQWDTPDHGVYTIYLPAGQAADVLGNTNLASNLGHFEVKFIPAYLPWVGGH
jgi:sugar lactone lactonase YvrE